MRTYANFKDLPGGPFAIHTYKMPSLHVDSTFLIFLSYFPSFFFLVIDRGEPHNKHEEYWLHIGFRDS